MKSINCNLCGSPNHELIFRNWDRLHRVDHKLFDLVRCRRCGLIFINPQPIADELSRYYPDEYGPYQEINEPFKYGYFSKALAKINKSIGQGKNKLYNDPLFASDRAAKTCLDFGCGSGRFLADLRAQYQNWDLYGLDNNEKACARARRLGLKIFCGDILKMELPVSFFDIVNLGHVIEHLPDPLATMQKINKILKDSGTVVISTPNIDSLAAKIFGRFWYALDTPRHLFIFSPATLSALLEKSGFTVNNIKYKVDPQVAIKSWYLFLRKKDMRLNPVVWRFYKLLSRFIFLFYRRASIMTIYAQKSRR